MVAGEIRTDTVTLDNVPLRIIGPVQGPSLLTPLAEKVTIGEHTRADDVILSSWVVSNLRGGLGVARLDTATQSDRYRFGTCWVLQDQEILLPALPVEVTTGIPASTEGRVGATYAGHVYIVFNTKVRLYVDASAQFLTPSEVGYADLSGNATDAVSIRLAATDYLVIADGAGLTSFNGVTWTRQTGNGTTIPVAQWIEEFDNNLYVLDTGNVLWKSPDLTTWTKLARIPMSSGDVKGLDLFFAPDESPKLHAPAVNGLWLYDTTADVWQRTRLRFPRHAGGGLGHAMWRDEYFESAGMDVYHYQGSAISPASLNRDDGLPRDYQGTIVALEPLPSQLAAAVSGAPVVLGSVHYRADALNLDASQAPEVAALSAIYLWTGSAWQPLWVGSNAGTVMHFLHYSDADNTYRLWWNTGERIYYITFNAAVFNPRLSPSWPFAQTSFFETGRFDGAWPEQQKLAIRTKVRLKNASATERALIYYRIDQSDTWVYLATVDASGVTTIEMEDTPGLLDGMLFYDFEYRVVLERGTAETLSPTLVFVKLEYQRKPDARFGYRFQVVVDEPVGGYTPEEIVDHLQSLAANKHRVEFEYRPTLRSPVTRKVVVSQWTAITTPGIDTTGRWMLSLIEP